MHYVVETRTKAGGWLRLHTQYKLLSDAKHHAAVVRDGGSVVRIVCVMQDGSRTVVEE